MTEPNKKTNPLDDAADLLQNLKDLQGIAKDTVAVTKETYDQLTLIGRAAKRTGEVMGWIKERVIEPIGTVLPFLQPVGRAIRNQYAWFCFPREPFIPAVRRAFTESAAEAANGVANVFRSEKKPYMGEEMPLGKFSKGRAGVAALATAFVMSPLAEQVPLLGQFIPDFISDHAVATVYEPPYDAARMSLTAIFHGGLRHEQIHLNGKNEIDPKADVWSANGCEDGPSCSPDDAITFRIKSSAMHQAWSLATGRGPFLPDYVAAAIPNVPSKCDVISYAPRWRVSKWLNSYPMMLDVKCSPLALAPVPDRIATTSAVAPAGSYVQSPVAAPVPAP